MFAHIDADSFFASVLLRKHPHLKGKPLFAIGMGGSCIIAATYEAKAKGVRTGMRLTEARLLCPGATEMPSDFRETGIASQQIESIIKNACPVIEQMSIDEWYLDIASIVGGIPHQPDLWARGVQAEVLQSTDISVSVGIATSKLLAKMAGEYRKPAGVTALTQSDIEAFLKDRPAAAIPGIGRKRQIVTERYRWNTAWDIAKANTALLIQEFGRPAREMQRELHGERVFTVSLDVRPPKSVSRCRAFRPTNNRDLVRAHLIKHLEYTVEKMRRWNLGCSDVSAWVRTKDFAHHGAHAKLQVLSNTVEAIAPAAIRAFEYSMKGTKAWNQVGLALFGLHPLDAHQESLFDDPGQSQENEELQKAMDALHTRFGRDSVTHASALSVSTGTKHDIDLPIIE